MNASPVPTFGQLPDKLRSLLLERGVAADAPIIPLKDGGNNQVCRLAGGKQDYVLKRYFQHPTDTRDRFTAERVFYKLLWNGGLRQIPEPCGWDAEHRLGLFAFVPGRKLNPAEVTSEAVKQATEFVNQINALREHPAAQEVSAASEAYFSVTEQADSIARRVAAIQQIEPQSEMDIRAVAFARDELLPAWRETADAISRRAHADRDLNKRLGVAERCLSPSDFGFHNALLAEDSRLHFIDFEYAGWDDPAKLACDFFCQPQVPVGFEFWDLFMNSFAAGPDGGNGFPSRARLLLPAYQIKWCCIMLNHFVKAGKARREFARGVASEEAKAMQLEKARRLLQDIHKLRD